MPFTSVLRALGAVLAAMSVLSGLCALYAVARQETEAALSLGGVTAIALFFGVSGTLIGRNLETPTGPREGVAMLLGGWTLLPLIASLGFWDRGGLASFADAYFEAMSAFTTTGFTLLEAETANRSILLWRSLLEWSGGYFSILSILVILVALNLAGPGVLRSVLFTVGGQGLTSRFWHITREAGIVYVLMTFLTFVGLLLSGAEPFNALILGLSAPATGGAAPVAGAVADYVPPLGLVALTAALIAGSLNYALLFEAYRDSVMRGDILRDVETRGLMIVFGLLLCVVLLSAPGFGPQRLAIAAHDAAALISTSARFADPAAMAAFPPPLLLGVTLIGGSALSTAGGLKLVRLILLGRHARLELMKLSFPSSVEPVRFRERVVPDRVFIGLWIYFLGFTAALALITLGIAASGVEFQVATSAAVAALSNAGPLLSVVAPGADPASLGVFARVILMLAMALGRMETLAALAMFAPGLWRR